MSTTPPETLFVDEKSVACDGGNGSLGHPRVYLTMGDADSITCPYCDRTYVLKDSAAAQKQVQEETAVKA